MLSGFALLLVGSFMVFFLSISQGGEIAPRDAGCTTDFFPIEQSGQSFCSLALVNYVSPFRFQAPAYGCKRDVQCPWPSSNSVMRYMASFLGMGVAGMASFFMWGEIWSDLKKTLVSYTLYGAAVFQFACFCIDANSYRVGSGLCELGFFQNLGQVLPTSMPSTPPGRRLVEESLMLPANSQLYESVIPEEDNRAEVYAPVVTSVDDGGYAWIPEEEVPSAPPAYEPGLPDTLYESHRRRLAPSPVPTHPGQRPTFNPAQRPNMPPNVMPSQRPTMPVCQFASIFGRALLGVKCDNSMFQTVVATDFILACSAYCMVLVFRRYLRFLKGDRRESIYDEVPESKYDKAADPREQYQDDYSGGMNVPNTLYEDDNRSATGGGDDDQDYGNDAYADAAEDKNYGSTAQGDYGDNAYN